MSSTDQQRPSGTTSSTPPELVPDDEIEDDYDDIFAYLRATNLSRARAGDLSSLLSTAANTISHLSSAFVTGPHVDFSGGWLPQLQTLWHLYFVAAKYCRTDGEQMLACFVLQLIQTSQRGLLARSQISGDGSVTVEHAPVVLQLGGCLVEKYLWQDLPLLVPDMTSYWAEDCARMSPDQRQSVSTFWSSLVAASSAPWSNGLCRIALILLRDTLETQRRLIQAAIEPGGENSENSGRTMDMLTTADLLRPVNIWLTRAGGKIVQLCEAGDSGAAPAGLALPVPVPDEDIQLGPLAQAAGIRPTAGGFSTQRWLYWLRRLDEIGAESMSPQPATPMVSPFVQRARGAKELARQVARDMIFVASQSNSTIVQELIRMGRLPLGV